MPAPREAPTARADHTMTVDIQRLAVALALLVAALGCKRSPHLIEQQAALAPPAAQVAPAGRRCFLLHELGVGEIVRAPAEGCSTRVTPASTFKIAHALAGLDAGVLKGA